MIESTSRAKKGERENETDEEEKKNTLNSGCVRYCDDVYSPMQFIVPGVFVSEHVML